MAAVCRCFPGKLPTGGDRVPAPDEIKNCSRWLAAEMKILQPHLVLAVGKLAIRQFIPCDKLDTIIGTAFSAEYAGHRFDLIPPPPPPPPPQDLNFEEADNFSSIRQDEITPVGLVLEGSYLLVGI
jgi:uracil-DNA glycosylase